MESGTKESKRSQREREITSRHFDLSNHSSRLRLRGFSGSVTPPPPSLPASSSPQLPVGFGTWRKICWNNDSVVFLGRRLLSVHAGEPKSFRGPSGYLIPRAAAILSTPDAPIITSLSGEYPGVIYWCLNYHLTYKNLNSILRSKNRGSSSASESLIVNTCFWSKRPRDIEPGWGSWSVSQHGAYLKKLHIIYKTEPEHRTPVFLKDLLFTFVPAGGPVKHGRRLSNEVLAAASLTLDWMDN